MLNQKKILEFYSRKDIQEEITRLAKDREIQVWFNDQPGKRPDTIQFKGDVLQLAKKGATSFHFSEEHWNDPEQLKAGMTKNELDKNRLGWDLLIDIDTKFIEYARKTAELIVQAFESYGIENYSVKFSGNKGFHLAVPYKAFPNEVNGLNTKLLFPDGPRVIAAYLKHLIKPYLSKEILKMRTKEEIAKSLNIEIKQLLDEKGEFNPFSIIELDTVLISSRHLFRGVYSFNEKSGLVSIPIKKGCLKDFKLSDAKPENIKEIIPFLDDKDTIKNEAKAFIITAYDWHSKHTLPLLNISEKTKELTFEKFERAIPKELFPNCIKIPLERGLKDGKKRFLFILLNFIRSAGWNYEDIEKELKEWNTKNPEPLRETYLLGQINWHKHQKKNILPPNCTNSIYKDLGLCIPNNFCKNIKNPMSNVTRKLRTFKNKPEKKTEKKAKNKK